MMYLDKTFKSFDAFNKDDCGAVTVDWVVMSAFLVVLGLGIGSKIGGATTEFVGKVSAVVTAQGDAIEASAGSN